MAAVGSYFRDGRDPSRAKSELEMRTDKAKRREQLASQIINTRAMLDLFLAWDRGEPDPTRFRATPVLATVLGWNMRIGHDLVYETAEGLRLRQLLTDDAIRRGEHLRLFAVASLLHFEAGSPDLRLATVEVWHLRANRRMLWPRQLLLRLVPDLRTRLDQVAAALADNAA